MIMCVILKNLSGSFSFLPSYPIRITGALSESNGESFLLYPIVNPVKMSCQKTCSKDSQHGV